MAIGVRVTSWVTSKFGRKKYKDIKGVGQLIDCPHLQSPPAGGLFTDICYRISVI